ncbi:MAG: response regulator transcription factor [Actinomycetota bacterium]|nr:response regulator transcription factor [Actinomycetota bacterium]
MTRPNVLVVEDDRRIADVVSRYLRRDGFDVETVGDGALALERILGGPVDLVVLDLLLPGLSGFEVFRRLRAVSPVPVIVLSALGAETDRVAGLELGVDDYVTKPFSPRELALRVRSVLRRTTETPANGARLLEDGGLTVNIATHEVGYAGRPLSLASREFDLLVFLMRHPRSAFTRQQLLERVWGWSIGDPSTVTVHIRRLREKLEEDPVTPTRLVTVWGVGYRYQPVEGAPP